MKHLFPLILAGLCTLPLITPATGQQRYLVSPNDEVIRLNPGDDPASIVGRRSRPADPQVCASKFFFGYDWVHHPDHFLAYHGDVMGEWFVAKATGTIDTIFFSAMLVDSAQDSTVYLRVHRSHIGPDYGPGIRPGPFNPPCQQWGYWVDTNNPDGGITAFPESATDTAWHSTILGSSVPSTPPLGESLWGSSGYPVKLGGGGWQFAAMDWLTGPIPVTVGDVFFITLQVPRGCHPDCPPGEPVEAPIWFEGVNFSVSPADEDYPSRFWKFYAHDPIGACGAFPADSLVPGWRARGGAFSQDSLNVTMLAIGYAMTVTTNVPPLILDDGGLHTTFSTAPRQVTLTIEDCDPGDPGNAGVAGGVVRYSVDGAPQPDIPLASSGADIYQATIPGQPPGTSVVYRSIAWDNAGDTGTAPARSYTVVPFGTEWFSIDTGYACVDRDISSSGAEIDTGAFFVPAFPGSGTEPKDNGTAGPVDMGSSFILFGRPFRYAWIGINGGMALSASPTDTQDVNANGRWLPPDSSNPWTIPGPSKEGRGTPLTAADMPGVYIAAMGADHIIGDSAGQYGRILTGNAGDTCLFIVQWDSMGAYDDGHSAFPDVTTFRAILNRCDGSVEFQYWSVGSAGLETAGLIGMQISPELAGTPGPGYVTVNRLGYPIETRPFDGYCVRFFPAVGMVVEDGWSLVSLPVAPRNGDFRTSVLFPELESRMYSYPYGTPPPANVSPGTGYWLKSPTTLKIGHTPGTLFHELSVPVHDGWNLIGGTSDVVASASIVPIGTTVSSLFFGYGPGGYNSAAALKPGSGYWVKVAGEGTLTMNSWGSAPVARPGTVAAADESGFNAITFTDAGGRSQTLHLAGADRLRGEPGLFELPPSPPEGSFDVRFASGRWVETIPGDDETTASRAISIRGAAFPVTVRWILREGAPDGSAYVLKAPGGGDGVPMAGTGSTVLADPKVVTVSISLWGGGAVPAGFSLGDNYPNPFNPSTVIRYSVPRAVFVSLKVFNMIGEEVATLVAEELAPGDHTAEWRPDGLPSGIYFCRLTAGEFSGTKKLVFMK